ncbi:efflux RND transporter periplasmic adaptor subunit [Brevibacillus fluminis]|uniref:Efflux RND transporter periplasmic adaptor subunit n=1 Tax=Brevibacillus fluminis TaxID=511487 RepID=A0A3M8CWE6_9BACL|nr:efflux RND transporter periplasmic adaptor subunit [Brevibacillus fluminis]RNB80120.1 efflux RND transporter periplasmic adaptor subunit [Brevibacillus fluminis]
MKKITMKKHQNIAMYAAVLSLSVLFAGCSADNGTVGQAVGNPVVQVIKAGNLTGNQLMISGKVTPNQEVQVVSKVAGRVSTVSVDEGSIVKAGDALVKLEADDYNQQVIQARAALASARAKLADTKAGTRSEEIQRQKSGLESSKAAYDNAQKTLERTKSLFTSGAVSQTDLEKAQLALEQAKSGYEQLQAQLQLSENGPTGNTIQALQAEVDRLNSSVQLAEISVNNTTVKSPIAGIVAKRSIDPGELATPGAPLFTVVDMKTVQVQFSVNQDQINLIQPGATVEMKTNSIPDKTFKGTVIFISPISDAGTNTFPVKVKVDNAQGLLRSGMIMDATIGTSANATRIEVPTSSLVKDSDKTYLYTVTDGVAHRVEVKTEDKDANWSYVTNGLDQASQVIVNPGSQLKDGDKVTVK